MISTFRTSASLACAAALLATPVTRAQTPVTTWAQSYGVGTVDPDNGGSVTGYDIPFGIAPMPDGGVVVVGQLDLPSAKRHGAVDASAPGILIRYRADGATLWQVRTTVLNNADFLTPTDLANNTPGDVQVAAIRTDAQGNIYVSGEKNVSDNGFERPFVAKFDPNGALLWQNSLGFVTYHRTDADNQPVTNTGLAGTTFINFSLTPDGGVLACTSVAVLLYNTVHDSPLIAKFGPDGTLQYVRSFDYPGRGTDSEPAYAACQSLDGSRTLTLVPGGGDIAQPGNVTPSTAILTDSSGAIVAERQYYLPDNLSSYPAQVFATTDGGWITYSQLAVYDSLKNYGAVLRKLNADLTPAWEKIISVPGYESYGISFLASPTLALTADGGFLLSGRLDGRYYSNVLGGYSVGSEDFDVVLLKLDAGGRLQGVYQIGGPRADNIGEAPGRGPIGYPHATPTADGGFVFTTPTFSYVTPANASNAVGQIYPDWWTVKTDPNGRVQAFGDIQAKLPLSIFSVVDDTAASVAGGAFVAAGTAGYPQQGYAGVGADVTPTFVAGAFNGTGDDHPNQQVQAGLFTGPVLPVTTAFRAYALSGVGAGELFTFTATQTSTVTGLTVRVQASPSPEIESSWVDDPDGSAMQSDGHGHWSLSIINHLTTDEGAHAYFYRAIATVPGYHDSVSLFALPNPHAPFFDGEVSLGNGVYYLRFPNGTPFGYYSYLSDPHYIFHFDLGYLYTIDASDGHNGAYFFDFGTSRGSLGFFYTAPDFSWPYLYDFDLDAYLYCFPDTGRGNGYYFTDPRIFSRLDSGQVLFY